MAKGLYVGEGALARKVKKLYVGVDGKARKIKKGYIGVDGKARLFFSSEQGAFYTGAMSVQEITDASGARCRLYTLTSSGTLNLSVDAPIRAWCCGGGGDGSDDYQGRGGGGGGGGGYTASGTLPSGTYAVVIGGARGTSSIGSALTAGGGQSGYLNGFVVGVGGNGGSGGGGGAGSSNDEYYHGSGAGASTIPFGIASLQAHCAGGGGGTYGNGGDYGGNGGSNGSGGTDPKTGWPTAYCQGGQVGGGNGGQKRDEDGSNATFYGSGGGGAAAFSDRRTTAGRGYQGVAYLLLPIEE